MKQESRITRRGFIINSGVLLAASIPNATSKSVVETTNSTSSDLASSFGKIALEEHFDFSETAKASYASFGGQEFQRQINDLGSGRIAEMDRGGVEVCIVSLVGPGI